MYTNHGLSHTREYKIYANMLQRVLNPNNKSYKNYGGRGITICERWLQGFQYFYEDMGSSNGLTIDRIDNSKGYSKENCRWATVKEQGKNRRTTILYDYNGQKRSLAEITRENGFSRTALFYRVRKLGWSLEKALSTPIHNNHV